MVNSTNVEALLATQNSTEIVQAAARTSIALSGFTREVMSTKKTRTPLVSILPTAGWESGELGSDSRKKTVSDWGVEPKYLVAQPLATIIPIPEEVLEDSTFDIWGAIKPGLATVFGKLIDQAVLFGVNKPAAWTDDAIVPAAIKAGNVVDSGRDLADRINQAFAYVEEDGYDVSGVAGKRSLRSALRGMRDDNGAPIFTSEVATNPGTIASVFNAPFYPVSNGAWDAEQAECLVGDFSTVHIGVRQDMAFKVLDQATLVAGGKTIHLGQEDAVALRVTFRVAYAVFDPANPESADGYPFAIVKAPAPKPAPVKH